MASSRQSLAGIGSKANSRASLAPGRASLAPPKHGRQSLAPGQQAAMDRRKSSIASAMGRRSSVAPGASGRKPADPRQITDKAFKERSIRKLIEYLVEHGYERTLSPQLLTAPQTKDFVFIVSFLLRAAIPNFKFDAKFEDELPAVLKSLGYPYTISQSALKSVGAPHAWPTLLAALAWLVDLLNYSEAEAARRETGEAGFDGEEDGYSKMFLDYLARGYALFLSGEDDLSALDEEIAFTFESKNASFTTDIASLTTANAELSTQLATLTDGDTPLQKAQAHNRDLQSDTAKFEKHIADLHGHRSKVQEKLEGEKKKLALRQEELRTVQAEVLQSKETIARQDLTPADVRRMHSERDHLESELASTKAQKDALSAQLWDEEVAVSRSLERLEDKIQRLNNCSLRLHLIPAEAKNARGASHEVFLNPKKLANEPEGLLSVEPSAVLVPGLQRVKAGFSAELSAAQDALLECEEEGTRREEQGHERSDELARLKAELGKLEREEKRLREEHAKELADRKAETDRLEESLQSAKSANGQSVVASQSELAALQKELDEFTEDAAKKREKMYLHLVSSLDMLALHKENVEKQLASLKQHCAAKMEMLQPLLVDEVVDLE